MSVWTTWAGHRERKKQRTKEKLVEAELGLFVEQGYDETRIDDIVAEVDLSLAGYDTLREEGRRSVARTPARSSPRTSK